MLEVWWVTEERQTANFLLYLLTLPNEASFENTASVGNNEEWESVTERYKPETQVEITDQHKA